jgi:hypothetical protein
MLRHFIVALCLALSLPVSALASEAGRVVFVVGQVQLAHKPAVLDAAVQEGDELQTGADGYVYMKTVDSGFLILRPNSKARITTYHVDTVNAANTHVKLELLEGTARSISGQAVKHARQNFRFNTPVAAIGVRGTDFIVFTDQQTSRVAVVSGGVVVSGFAGACGPDGGGPCEGAASRELFAGQSGMLLQVQRGQTVPQLLRNPQLSPDLSAPPRADEPVGKPPVATTGTLTAPDVSLDAQKGSNLPVSNKPIVVQNPDPTTTPVTPPVAVPDPVVVVDPAPSTAPLPPPPVVKSAPEVMWGRWQAVAGVAPDPTVLANLKDSKFANGFVVGAYAIKRLADATFVLPHEGTASFVLADSEVTLQKTGEAAVFGKVDNARLNINFVDRSFSTALTVTGGGNQLNVVGNGDISLKGELISSPISGALIRGYLGGAHVEEAGYVFQSLNSPTLTAAGATHWSR